MRHVSRNATFSRMLPEFDSPSPPFAPDRVEIQDEIYSAAQLLSVMVHAEIGVKIQISPSLAEVQPPTLHGGIREQVGDSSQRAHPCDELRRVKIDNRLAKAGREHPPIGHSQLVFVVVPITRPGIRARHRKLLSHT